MAYNLENTKVMAMSINIGEKENVSSDTKITGESLVENCKFIVFVSKQIQRMFNHYWRNEEPNENNVQTSTRERICVDFHRTWNA